MIKNILQLLNYREYLGVSETIEIAKGKYKIPRNVSEAFNQFKRDLKWL
jgi:hypothetical protein